MNALLKFLAAIVVPLFIVWVVTLLDWAARHDGGDGE